MTHDQKSYELAEYFAQGLKLTPADMDSFANAIQQAVEDWIDMNTPEE
jgi:hypothetical protein